MTRITIRELNGQDPNAVVVFDGGEEYPVHIDNPFGRKAEEDLEWYFEEHLRFPFIEQVRAKNAAASIARYGKDLFDQVFADRRAFARYQAALQSGVENLAFEIAGSPDFHALHWEALKDPDLPQPFALEAPFVRGNLNPQTVRAQAQVSPTINILVVTARPLGAHDVAYRTISRPLVHGLRQAGIRVRIEILRPGTYRKLVNHLDDVRSRPGTGYYHVIHFDVHGGLLSYDELQAGGQADRYVFQARYRRNDLAEYVNRKAFLFLESDTDGQADPVEAGELADLLLIHQVPIVILNACQSAKQVATEGPAVPADARETSLGSRLMAAGVQMVLAMSYSITVTAAEKLMTTLYERLYDGDPPSTAIRRGRQELSNSKERKVYYDQKIDLEDWLLPVVYQNSEQTLTTREFTPEEAEIYYGQLARRYQPPAVTYEFVGRDLDVLQVEKRLLTRNILLIRGMGGAGKTTLLHHLGEWWQTTGFTDRVIYFGYDERAWTLEQILHRIAETLMTDAVRVASFQPQTLPVQQQMIAERLRGHRHLLILDNLESITGTHLAVCNTLSEDEQQKLRGFLADLTGGRTFVLLGSRGGEDWLARGTFDNNVYDLPGLDPEAASALAERILERHGATQHCGDDTFQRLTDLLAGYPMALEVVLSNLDRKTPEEVLDALQSGDTAIDMRGTGRTESLMQCIEYSYSNLSPEAQQLLLCLAPFTSVLDIDHLPEYSEKLREQPALEHLPYDLWDEVLQEAINWGLMTPHVGLLSGYLDLQPIMPYFLRSQLVNSARHNMEDPVKIAYAAYFDHRSNNIMAGLVTDDPQEHRQVYGPAILEYENLRMAIEIAMHLKRSVRNPFRVISALETFSRTHKRGLRMSLMVEQGLESYPTQYLNGAMLTERVEVLDDIAYRHLELKQYSSSESTYKKALSIWQGSTNHDPEEIRRRSAAILHQLGAVAEQQRDWSKAQQHYQQALEIKSEFNNIDSLAKTYHQLGIVAYEQRDLEKARYYFLESLKIKESSGDRYSCASAYHQLGVIAQDQRRWGDAEICIIWPSGSTSNSARNLERPALFTN